MATVNNISLAEVAIAYPKGRWVAQHLFTCPGPPVPFYPLFGEGSTKVDYRKKASGTLILTSLLEDLAADPRIREFLYDYGTVSAEVCISIRPSKAAILRRPPATRPSNPRFFLVGRTRLPSLVFFGHEPKNMRGHLPPLSEDRLLSGFGLAKFAHTTFHRGVLFFQGRWILGFLFPNSWSWYQTLSTTSICCSTLFVGFEGNLRLLEMLFCGFQWTQANGSIALGTLAKKGFSFHVTSLRNQRKKGTLKEAHSFGHTHAWKVEVAVCLQIQAA